METALMQVWEKNGTKYHVLQVSTGPAGTFIRYECQPAGEDWRPCGSISERYWAEWFPEWQKLPVFQATEDVW